MFELIKSYFVKPSPKVMMETQLLRYEQELVDMKATEAYARKMVELYVENIARLKNDLGHDVDPRQETDRLVNHAYG